MLGLDTAADTASTRSTICSLGGYVLPAYTGSVLGICNADPGSSIWAFGTAHTASTHTAVLVRRVLLLLMLHALSTPRCFQDSELPVFPPLSIKSCQVRVLVLHPASCAATAVHRACSVFHFSSRNSSTTRTSQRHPTRPTGNPDSPHDQHEARALLLSLPCQLLHVELRSP